MSVAPPTTPPSPPTKRQGWTAGRIVSVVIGSVLGLVALAVLAGAGAATWATNSQRDASGFLTSDARSFTTPSYAITSDAIDLGNSSDWATPADVLGTVRFRATPASPSGSVFIGIGPQNTVNSYLARFDHAVVTNWENGSTEAKAGLPGAAPQVSPALAPIWAAKAIGPGTQSLTWKPTNGSWTVVVMNPNGAAGVAVSADAGATVPDLAWFAVGLWVVGGLLLALAVVLVALPVVRAGRRMDTGTAQPGPEPPHSPGPESGPTG